MGEAKRRREQGLRPRKLREWAPPPGTPPIPQVIPDQSPTDNKVIFKTIRTGEAFVLSDGCRYIYDANGTVFKLCTNCKGRKNGH